MILLFTQPGSQTFRQSLTLMALSLGFGVVQLDVTIVNTALSTIGTALGGGIAELQWVVSAYTTAFAALICQAARSAIASEPRQSSCPGSPYSRWRR